MSSLPSRPPRDRRRYRASRLREVLVETGVSQADIARDLDVTRPVVNQYVMGHRTVSFERAERIASLLERPVPEVFEPIGP